MNWHEILENVAAVIATCAILGGIMFGILKSFFVTGKECTNAQDKCQKQVCMKVDLLKKDVKEINLMVNKHYAEIKSSLGEINGKLGR